jgi:hypothetical protein
MSDELSNPNTAATSSVSPVGEVPSSGSQDWRQKPEMQEYAEYCSLEYPVLEAKEKAFDKAGIKTWRQSWEYWHNIRLTMIILDDPLYDGKYALEEYYRDVMKLGIEILKDSQQKLDEDSQVRWYDYWACTFMDWSGEAHCKLRHQYYPTWGPEPDAESKKIWEEIIELDNQRHELMPKKKRERLDKWYESIRQSK